MGGWMPYSRFRARNGLLPRVGYDYSVDHGYRSAAVLIGDLDRMERDYLDPVYPEPPFATRPEASDPLSEVARATGVDRETVREVLRCVFFGPETP